MGVILTLLLMLTALAWPGSVQHQTWLAVSVDMDHFLKNASLESTITSEPLCASLAWMNYAEMYCYQPGKCYKPSITVFKEGKTTGGWTCRSKKNREFTDVFKVILLQENLCCLILKPSPRFGDSSSVSMFCQGYISF